MAKKEKKTTKKAVAKKAVTKSKKTAKATPKKKTTTTPKAVKPASKKKTSIKSTGKKTAEKREASKAHLTPAEIEHYRTLLMEKLHELLGDVDWIEQGALRQSRLDNSGDLSNMPIHMADIGTDNYEQEFSLGLMDSERRLVREIFDALKRIERGTYGICEGTGEPIPKARLDASPWARYCVQYASLIEQGKATDYSNRRNWSNLSRFSFGEDDYDYDEEEDEEEELHEEEPIEEEEEEEEETDLDDSFLEGYDEDEEEEEPAGEEF